MFAQPQAVRFTTGVLIVICAFLTCVSLTKRHVTSWNDGSRFATVDALVANHSFAIDGTSFGDATGDKMRSRGKTYSDKPPLLAMLGAGVAEIAGIAGISLRRTPQTAIYLITLLTVGLFYALGCWYAYAFARRLGCSERRSAAVAGATAFATLALPYATVFTNHVPAGVAGFAACYHLFFERQRVRGPLLGGFFVTLAYAFDPAAVIFFVPAAILLAGAPLRTIALFAAACVPIVVGQVAYNVVVTGSPLPPIFNAAVWRDSTLPEYLPPSSPIFAFASPRTYLQYAYDALFGTKGLFVYSPIAFVCAFGLRAMWKSDARARRLAIAIASTVTVLFLLIVFFQNDEGARNFGERRYVDIAFLACASLSYAFAVVRGALACALVELAVGVSAVIASFGAIVPFGGKLGESGFSFAWQTLVSIEQRNAGQAIEDVCGAAVLGALVVWLTRRALSPAAVSAAERIETNSLLPS